LDSKFTLGLLSSFRVYGVPQHIYTTAALYIAREKIMKKKGVTKLKAIVVAIIIVVVVVAGALSYFYLMAPAGGPEEIRVGASVPMSGELATWGKYLSFGYRYMLDKINKEEGGIYIDEVGKKLPVRLIIYDDESSPDKCAKNTERLILEDKVVALLSSGTPPIGVPGCTVAERYGVPIITASLPLEVVQEMMPKREYTWNIFFSIADPDVSIVARYFQALETVPPELNNKKLVLFLEDSPEGVAFGNLYKGFAEKYKYQVVYEVYVPLGTTDFTDMIRKAQASGADIVMGLMIPPEGWAMLKQAYTLGWRPKFMAISKAFEPHDFVEAVGARISNGTCHLGFWAPWLYPGGQELADAYMKQYNEFWSQHIGDAAAAAQVLGDAIKRARSLDPKKIHEAIKTTDLMTVNGRIRFVTDPNNPYYHQYIIPAFMMQWQNGEFKIVWPPEMSNAQFWYPMPP
jgi:branched-chain amino acid transport system substrate-binding protein